MSIVCSCFWGLIVFNVMFFTIKYYVPYIFKNMQKMISEAHEKDENLDDEAYRGGGEKKDINFANKSVALILIFGTIFAAWCGYVSFEHHTSIINLLKVTLAFAVLSCVSITDFKLFIIPNTCSLCLIGGRIVCGVLEVIWMPDKVLTWFANSIIALVISLLFLLVMTKVTRGGIGFGDVKIISSLSFLCGISAMYYTLLFSSLLCSAVATILLLGKKKQLKDSLPLGPFIWIGFGITILLSII